jgi:hypothetical protein
MSQPAASHYRMQPLPAILFVDETRCVVTSIGGLIDCIASSETASPNCLADSVPIVFNLRGPSAHVRRCAAPREALEYTAICDIFGSNGAAQAAQQQTALLQQQAAARTKAINTDTSEIDSAFAPFNDAYYQNYQKAYEDNYNPQLDFQYGRAQGQLASNLAGADQDGGSTGARATADLYQDYAGA